MIIYIGYFKPFRDKIINSLEITNEVLNILMSFHVFIFTDWITNKER